MIINKLETKNAFKISDLDLTLKGGDIVVYQGEMDPFFTYGFFHMLRALLYEEKSINDMGSKGEISCTCKIENMPIYLKVARVADESLKEVLGEELRGYTQNITETLLYPKDIENTFEYKLNIDYRTVFLNESIRDYCFFIYDTMYCLLEVLYHRYKTQSEENVVLSIMYKEYLKKLTALIKDFKPFKISQNLFLRFNEKGEKVFLDSENKIINMDTYDINSKDEVFAEFIDFYFANKCILEIYGKDYKQDPHPLFFMGLLSKIRQEQIPYAIFLLKELGTQVFLEEEIDLQEYKDLFDVYVVE